MYTVRIIDTKVLNLHNSCPRKDPRQVLMGVHVCEDGTIEATDGRQLNQVFNAASWLGKPMEHGLIIPADMCKAIAKEKSAVNMVGDDGDIWTATFDNGKSIEFERIVGYYPRTSAIVPDLGEDQAIFAVNPYILMKALEAAYKSGVFRRKENNLASDQCALVTHKQSSVFTIRRRNISATAVMPHRIDISEHWPEY